MAMRAADMQRSFAETLENCRRLRQRLVEESELIRLSGLKRREADEDNRTGKSPQQPHAERYEIDIDETNEPDDQTFLCVESCPIIGLLTSKGRSRSPQTYFANECLRLKAP